MKMQLHLLSFVVSMLVLQGLYWLASRRNNNGAKRPMYYSKFLVCFVGLMCLLFPFAKMFRGEDFFSGTTELIVICIIEVCLIILFLVILFSRVTLEHGCVVYDCLFIQRKYAIAGIKTIEYEPFEGFYKIKMYDGRTLQLSIFYVGIKQFIQTLKKAQCLGQKV